MNLSHKSNSSRQLPVQNRARTSDKNSDLVVSNKKIKLSPISEDEGESFSDSPNHFVLCGRGERTNRHAGNKAFRRLVDINRSLYHSSDRRIKGLIATSIVQAIYLQNPPGKFVHQDKKSGLWIDVGMKHAIKKTSQALRENAPEKKKKTGKNDKQDHEDDPSETETDDKEYEHDDNSQDGDASQNNSVHFLSRQDFSSARAVTNEEVNNSEEEDNEFSSDEYEGFNHVVIANLDLLNFGILTKHSFSDEFPIAHNMTGVPPPPAFPYGSSDWILKSIGSVVLDMAPGVPPPSALTYGTSDWTFKSGSSTEEVPGVLVPPPLNFQTSDWTLTSIGSVSSDGAHSLTNDGGKAMFCA
jgi:hypothetical protein